MSPKHFSDADISEVDIDAMLFSLLSETDAETDNVVTGDFFRRHTVPAAAAAAVAAVSIATVWLTSSASHAPDVELATSPRDITEADLNPQLLSALAQGSDYSGLAEPQLAEQCVAVNVEKLQSETPKSNVFSEGISPLERVVGAAPVQFEGTPRQLFLLRDNGDGTTPGLTVLITEEGCGRVDAIGEPEAATVHVAALN